MDFDTEAIPIDGIGRIEDYELDVIIGVLTMEKWEIKIEPKEGMLDLDGFGDGNLQSFNIL